MKKILPVLLLFLSGLARAQTIQLTPIPAITVCAGTPLPVQFNTTGAFNAGNVFSVQLSNAAGSFAAPLVIGSLASVTGGIVSATVPANQPAGTQYRIRLVASSPAVTSADNGASITITQGATPTVSISTTATGIVCTGTFVSFTATATNGGANPYFQWTRNGIAQPGATSATYTSSTLQDNDVVQCILTSNAPCVTTTQARSNAVTVRVGNCGTQIVGGNAFLQDSYVEVAVGPCGNFASSVDAPAGFHPRGRGNRSTAQQLGFVANPDKNNWTSYVGDYFLPGSPEEGFGLSVNGVHYNNNLICDLTNIPGSISNVSSTAFEKSATWQGSIAGLSIAAKTFIPAGQLYFVTKVTVTNTSGSPVNNIFYMRNVDPDQGYNTPGSTGSYYTYNSVVFQNPNSCNRALVSATTRTSGSDYLGLGSIDPRARVTFGGFSNRSAANIWNGTGLSTTGTNVYGDNAISISFNIGTLAPNESTTFAYAYILKQDELEQALAATNMGLSLSGATVNIGNTNDICTGTAIPIKLSNTGTYTRWNWSPATGLDKDTGTAVNATISGPTIYTATGSGACGTVTLNVALNPVLLPTPDAAGAITGPAALTAGQKDIVYAIAPVDNATEYEWMLPPGATITSAANSHTITLAVSNNAWCGAITVTPKNACGRGTPSSVNVCINSMYSITADSVVSVCPGTVTAPLPYSAKTGNPNLYSITWGNEARAAGFANVSNASLPNSPITLRFPANAPAGTYYGNLTVGNGTFNSVGYPVKVVIGSTAVPAITLTPSATVPLCNGTEVTFTTTITNGGNAPKFRWEKNGATILGATGASYTTSFLQHNDSIRCVLTSNALCAPGVSVNSPYVKMQVIGAPPKTQELHITGCNGATYQGTVYENSATKRDTLKSVSGCDSLYTIAYIRVIKPITRHLTFSACNNTVTYQGVTYTSSTTKRDTLRSVSGCDSVYTIAGIVVTNTTPPDVPTNLLPANNSDHLGTPLSFSWGLVPRALTYDWYLWKASDTMPANPTVAGLTQLNFQYYGPIEYGASYKWKVQAGFGGCQTASAVQTLTTRLLPDLVVDSITVPATAISENNIQVNWRVKNTGAGATGSTAWQDVVYLSDRKVLGTGTDYYLGSLANFSALDAGSSYTSRPVTYTLPVGIQGPYYVIVRTDYNNSVREQTDTNNLRVSHPIVVGLKPPPDLQVDSLVVSPSIAFTGSPLALSFIVKNAGEGITAANSWSDEVYLSRQPVFQADSATRLTSISHSGVLDKGAYYKVSTSLPVPARLSGAWYLHIVADVNRQVFEHLRENNNTAVSLPLTFILSPTPNLQVHNVQAPVDTLVSNQPVQVQWTTRNEGAVATSGSWIEMVYLSKDKVFNAATAIAMGTITRSAALTSLAGSPGQMDITLPAYLPEGLYYWFVQTDASDSQYEQEGENDNLSVVSGPVYIRRPNLRAAALTVPATALSEQTVTVSWQVTNNSRAAIYNGSWYDVVYLAKDSSLQTGEQYLLKSPTVNRFLAPGETYTTETTVTLPAALSGNWYIVVLADAGNALIEQLETDNKLVAPIAVTLSPWADLVVTHVQVPATDTLGTPANISYTVTNQGTGQLVSQSWTDYIYLSPTGNLNDAGTFLFRSIAQNRSLAAGDNYTQTLAQELPLTLAPGSWRVVVVADAGKQIFEHTGEGNNSAVSQAMQLQYPTPIDLAVTGGQVNNSSVTAGKPVTLQWTVKNNTAEATMVPSWTDAVYISKDLVLDEGDRLLGSFTITHPLAAGEAYLQTREVTMPYDVAGTLYLLVAADITNRLKDPDRTNNYKAVSINGAPGGAPLISVVFLPVPDLQSLSLTGPATAYNGQPITVQYKVQNLGPGATPADSYTDRFYLSTSTTLTGSEIEIGRVTRKAALDSGAQYQGEVVCNIPAYVSGNYVLLVRTNADAGVYESNRANNTAITGLFIEAQLPSDLRVTRVTIPAGVQVTGSSITVDWELKNQGTNTAIGYCKEAVYLSKDTNWSEAAILLGTRDGYLSLPAQGFATHSLSAVLENTPVGNYHVLVRTDLLNNIVETNDTNNITASAGSLAVTVPELVINTLQKDTLENNQVVYYRIEVPASLDKETLSVLLKGDSTNRAENNLLISYGKMPAANSAEFTSMVPASYDQEVLIPALQQGTYYLTASGRSTANTRQPVTLLAKVIPFSIVRVAANKGGNTGSVTVQLNGSKFEPGMRVLLAGASEIVAQRVLYVNSTVVYATFNLSGKALGTYAVKAVNGAGTTAQLDNGFEIVPGSAGGSPLGDGAGFTCKIEHIGYDNNLLLGDDHPSFARPNSTVAITISFQNAGNVDIPVQKRFLVSKSGAPLSFSPDFTEQLQQLLLECGEPGGPPGILRPGVYGYIRVYAHAIAPLSFLITK